ncbi:acyl-CoA carboxylase subunit epsilon [Streptomyces sp. NBC_01244]|uniref:acyl-CoA carboxylase subunit epsilon n=1 Tax=Streptomyces sp. NBC_01244 TaxID=2903797 RepID=UPI002E107A18|nr:acyl-CoA carboxylase subunit epsilon [Streptomyces sp. NBC_01244]
MKTLSSPAEAPARGPARAAAPAAVNSIDPLISILRGTPDPAELAALTAVLLSRLRENGSGTGADRAEPEPAPARAPWSRPAFHSAGSWHAPDGLGR